VLIDLQEHLDPFTQPKKSAVCVAGAGVAGLVLATALAEEGVDVHLLEAGGRKNEDQSQLIYGAEMAATKHSGTTSGRFRVFGGSSTRWGGQILPYTEDVFCPPPALSTVGWPFSADALKPFYSRVEKILGINDLPFGTNVLGNFRTSVPADLHTNLDLRMRFSKWAPFSRRNLAQTLGAQVIDSGRITVFLHANLTECLLAADGSRIEAFIVRNYRGTLFRFTAQQYVVAAGTIETSRLLLASRSVVVNGVGNLYDQVGRQFHDHVEAPVAAINGPARKKLLSWMGPFVSRGTIHTGRFEATLALRKRLKLPAITAYLTIEEPEQSGMSVARNLIRSIQRGDTRRVIWDSHRQLPAACLQIIRLSYYARIKRRRAISSRAAVTLRVSCEQPVSPEKRIRLAETSIDPLGLPRAVVDWRVSNEEILAMRVYTQTLCEALCRWGVNSIHWHPDAIEKNGDKFPEIRDTNHPMGGTIMGANPRNSVVDDNLQVHGVSNLCIASCSTFPSGGSSNPTFTMMALALRLSKRLARLTKSD
jgi:choline dehydrogenase-like flavoprotein